MEALVLSPVILLAVPAAEVRSQTVPLMADHALIHLLPHAAACHACLEQGVHVRRSEALFSLLHFIIL